MDSGLKSELMVYLSQCDCTCDKNGCQCSRCRLLEGLYRLTAGDAESMDEVIDCIENLLLIINHGPTPAPQHSCGHPDSCCDLDCHAYANEQDIKIKANSLIYQLKRSAHAADSASAVEAEQQQEGD